MIADFNSGGSRRCVAGCGRLRRVCGR